MLRDFTAGKTQRLCWTQTYNIRFETKLNICLNLHPSVQEFQLWSGEIWFFAVRPYFLNLSQNIRVLECHTFSAEKWDKKIELKTIIILFMDVWSHKYISFQTAVFKFSSYNGQQAQGNTEFHPTTFYDVYNCINGIQYQHQLQKTNRNTLNWKLHDSFLLIAKHQYHSNICNEWIIHPVMATSCSLRDFTHTIELTKQWT